VNSHFEDDEINPQIETDHHLALQLASDDHSSDDPSSSSSASSSVILS
jgi:hypothetical protein